MISIKSASEIAKMQKAGEVVALTHRAISEAIADGITTNDLDKIAYEVITKAGAHPSFLHYNGFPKSICASINDEIIHGIPSSKRRLKEGDIISIDIGAQLNGYHGDSAATYGVGSISPEAQRLIDVTRQSFYDGIVYAREGYRISDISSAVQKTAQEAGFSVVREYVGHGVGRNLHEEPEVPNFGKPGHGARLYRGMTIAVEPMINAGGKEIRQLPDGWTVKTADGSLSAHYEHTVCITKDAPLLLTALG